MVSMTSQPVEIGDDVLLYHGGTKTHHDWWMCPEENLDEPEARDPNAAMRDGYKLGHQRDCANMALPRSMAARQRPGFVLTKPFRTTSDRLVINAKCRPGGSIQVEVLDSDRQPSKAAHRTSRILLPAIPPLTR